MKTKLTIKQLEKIIIDNFYDKNTNTIHLEGMEFEGKKIDLDRLRAEIIVNSKQKAVYIYNDGQWADGISNKFQITNE